MAKKVKEKTVFDDMPIKDWLAYIEKNAKDEDEKREMKVKARRSLTVENMAAYIMENDNTKAAKKAFKDAAIYTAKDENGNVSEAELTISTLNTRMARIIQEYNDPSKDKKGTNLLFKSVGRFSEAMMCDESTANWSQELDNYINENKD